MSVIPFPTPGTKPRHPGLVQNENPARTRAGQNENPSSTRPPAAHQPTFAEARDQFVFGAVMACSAFFDEREPGIRDTARRFFDEHTSELVAAVVYADRGYQMANLAQDFVFATSLNSPVKPFTRLQPTHATRMAELAATFA